MASEKSRTRAVDWTRRFLWHWEQSEMLPGAAAEIIVTVLQTEFSTSGNTESVSMPDPELRLLVEVDPPVQSSQTGDDASGESRPFRQGL